MTDSQLGKSNINCLLLLNLYFDSWGNKSGKLTY